ncbi:MAG: Fic family protein [Bacteroidota bacterium]
MATPSEKLAQSLEVLKSLQDQQGTAAVRSSALTRTHRERLVDNGFLQEVVKGWYIPTRPDEVPGDSTAWYTSFWHFCATYLQERFDQDWSLSPEQSLLIHSGNWSVPRQLLVRSPKAQNNTLSLPHGTSLFDIRATPAPESDYEEKEGLRVYTLPAALIACSPHFFSGSPMDARAALSLVRDASDLLTRLLEGGHSIIVGRLAGAFRNIGRDRIADEMTKTMQAAGYDVRESDPFTVRLPSVASIGNRSPYVNRIRLMWQHMRDPVLEHFPNAPGLPEDSEAYLRQVEEVFLTDAYHSLSIEGYRVTPELIERIRSGGWNPDTSVSDYEQRNALAARGYWQAYQRVRQSIHHVLQGQNPGDVVDKDHGGWYRDLFAPSVTAGLLKPTDLAGYRNGPVFIRQSMHVPLNHDAVRDAMPAFFELLQEETEPAVRVVLGHFIFVYIHPYMDGNGRIGRFLMNVMLAAGGYPWTVIPLEKRQDYMSALEKASVEQGITTFTQFLAQLVTRRMQGKPLPDIPTDSGP